ncbi:unnamed protein product [Closterium sp. NIES-64]|nr:unnamed protein product [Closterium sp. NIES-64]
MGNVTSWHARLSQDNPSDVIVDLSGLSARLPYHFHEVDGSFHLPYGLGTRRIALEDLVPLARFEQTVETTLPIAVEKKIKVSNPAALGGDAVLARLVASSSGAGGGGIGGAGGARGSTGVPLGGSAAGGGGVVREVLDFWDSAWRDVGRCDTDVGVVRVEARVSVDVCGFHRAELKPPSGWLDRGGIFLIGRAEGCAVIRLRVRFESERDARMDMVVAGVVGVLSVVALVAMRRRSLAAQGKGGVVRCGQEEGVVSAGCLDARAVGRVREKGGRNGRCRGGLEGKES